MDAFTGVQQFLLLPFYQKRLTGDDLKKAIEIARTKSPSAAFDVALVYGAIQGFNQAQQLGFAKGCRWLAMIRRDDSAERFAKVVNYVLNEVDEVTLGTDDVQEYWETH